MTEKRVSDSFTTQVQVLGQEDLNGYSRLFGGRLMSWMDIVAAVCARRHSGRNVTTARVEGLEFHYPARANDVMALNARMAYTGHTSMIVRVEAFVEQLSGEKRLTNGAWFVMVALDENEKPAPVPGLILETEEDRRLWNEAAELKQSFKRQAK